MNYKKIHDSLIIRCYENSPIGRIKQRNANDWRLFNGTVVYTESHHIVPRSLGGVDSVDNLVDVLPEEHLLLHLLRYKIYKTEQDLRAVNFMCSRINAELSSSRLYSYAWVRQQYSERCFGVNHPMYGKNHSEETKRKLSEFRLGKFYAKDVNTGEYLGLLHRTDHRVQNNTAVHVSYGIPRGPMQEDRSGVLNSNWSGFTDRDILEHAYTCYLFYGNEWSFKDWTQYCKKLNIPCSYSSVRFSEYQGSQRSRFNQAFVKYVELNYNKTVEMNKKTKNHKHQISKRWSGTVWVNYKNQEQKRVCKNQLTALIDEGWTLGRVK